MWNKRDKKSKEKPNEIQGKRKSVSLRAGLIFTISIVAVLCILLVSSAAYNALSSVERDKLRASTISDVQSINTYMENEYRSLIHVSQQFMPPGEVGQAIQRLLDAETPYERIVMTKALSENLNLMSYSNPNLGLMTCLSEDLGTISNLPARSDFDYTVMPKLASAPEIDFQGLHLAAGKFSRADVISITRAVTFDDEIERMLYIEIKTEALISLEKLSELHGVPYSLIQLNSNGEIVWSELAEFPIGDKFDLSSMEDGFGESHQYVWAVDDSSFDFKNVLLMPRSYYLQEEYRLLRDIVFSLLFAAAIIIFVSIMLVRVFYKPLDVLGEEITSVGGGNLDAKDYSFGITEYDALFDRFSLMKGQIGDLLDDVYRKEREKRQLELDKLYYQINPHFIMNALGSAQWQSLMHDEPELAEYLSNLNYILGYTLGKVNTTASIRSELKALSAYLELQQSRQDFQFTMDVEEGLYLDAPCARLIFQPIAENAVCHSMNEFGNLWVTTSELSDGSIKVVIKDDGAGFDTRVLSFKEPPPVGSERQTSSSNGIGLRYVWLTLDTYYNGKATMDVESAPGEGTTVTLVLPPKRLD